MKELMERFILLKIKQKMLKLLTQKRWVNSAEVSSILSGFYKQ